MADIEIGLHTLPDGSWSMKVSSRNLDRDGLEELRRVLGICQRIVDPYKLSLGDVSATGTMQILAPGEPFGAVCADRSGFAVDPERAPSPPHVPNGIEKSYVEDVPQAESSLSDKTEIVSPIKGPVPAPVEPPPQPEPKTPKPAKGGTADSLDMLNAAVAKKKPSAPQKEIPPAPDKPAIVPPGRKPLKYNSAVREDWPDNPHGLQFTALTHPLPGLQAKLMTTLRDLAVPEDGFGMVQMTDAELADQSGLGASSIWATLQGLEKKDLIEREGGSGSKIWVY